MRIALDVRGERGSDAIVRAQRALQQVGLRHKLKSYPANLSGGEQQRVAVARALVGAPSVMLADEPTAALDSENGVAVMQLLSEIAKDASRAVLAVTHDPANHSICQPRAAHRGRPDRRRGTPRRRRRDGAPAGTQQKAQGQCLEAIPHSTC